MEIDSRALFCFAGEQDCGDKDGEKGKQLRFGTCLVSHVRMVCPEWLATVLDLRRSARCVQVFSSGFACCTSACCISCVIRNLVCAKIGKPAQPTTPALFEWSVSYFVPTHLSSKDYSRIMTSRAIIREDTLTQNPWRNLASRASRLLHNHRHDFDKLVRLGPPDSITTPPALQVRLPRIFAFPFPCVYESKNDAARVSSGACWVAVCRDGG